MIVTSSALQCEKSFRPSPFFLHLLLPPLPLFRVFSFILPASFPSPWSTNTRREGIQQARHRNQQLHSFSPVIFTLVSRCLSRPLELQRLTRLQPLARSPSGRARWRRRRRRRRRRAESGGRVRVERENAALIANDCFRRVRGGHLEKRNGVSGDRDPSA